MDAQELKDATLAKIDEVRTEIEAADVSEFEEKAEELGDEPSPNEIVEAAADIIDAVAHGDEIEEA